MPQTAPCHFCQHPLDVHSESVFRLVEGWVKNRRQGGTNQVSLPVPKGRYACRPCIELRSSKAGLQQTESLW